MAIGQQKARLVSHARDLSLRLPSEFQMALICTTRHSALSAALYICPFAWRRAARQSWLVNGSLANQPQSIKLFLTVSLGLISHARDLTGNVRCLPMSRPHVSAHHRTHHTHRTHGTRTSAFSKTTGAVTAGLLRVEAAGLGAWQRMRCTWVSDAPTGSSIQRWPPLGHLGSLAAGPKPIVWATNYSKVRPKAIYL